jgi:uncharacterized SAM-dependent methyltransferase
VIEGLWIKIAAELAIDPHQQIVNAAGHTFAFSSGERLHTESSHKFSVDMFARLAAEADWFVSNTWISDAPQVALFRLEPVMGERS